jgi:hypothetical protein
MALPKMRPVLDLETAARGQQSSRKIGGDFQLSSFIDIDDHLIILEARVIYLGSIYFRVIITSKKRDRGAIDIENNCASWIHIVADIIDKSIQFPSISPGRNFGSSEREHLNSQRSIRNSESVSTRGIVGSSSQWESCQVISQRGQFSLSGSKESSGKSRVLNQRWVAVRHREGGMESSYRNYNVSD